MKGLSCEVTIKIIETDATMSGSVESKPNTDEPGKEVLFTGMKKGNTYHVKFKGEPPVVGANSEWLKLPWKIKTNGKSENLVIIFNAKDYESHGWKHIAYNFEACN